MEPKKSSKASDKRITTNKKISVIGMVLSLLGIVDATYLTAAHYSTKVVLACPDTGIINCAKVTTSTYSIVFGIPVPILGLVFFIGMFTLQLPMFWSGTNRLIERVRLAYSVIGLGSVFWFVYVELHILHAICLYCTGVHLLTFALFVTTIIGTSLLGTDDKVED